jgi:hypothetical protein
MSHILCMKRSVTKYKFICIYVYRYICNRTHMQKMYDSAIVSRWHRYRTTSCLRTANYRTKWAIASMARIKVQLYTCIYIYVIIFIYNYIYIFNPDNRNDAVFPGVLPKITIHPHKSGRSGKPTAAQRLGILCDSTWRHGDLTNKRLSLWT